MDAGVTEQGLTLRVVTPDELDWACELYWSFADSLADAEFCPAWQREVYPSRADLAALLAEGSLRVAYLGDDLVGAFALNHRFNDDYAGVAWPSGAGPDEAMVVHLLCVMRPFQGQGLGRRLTRAAVEVARAEGARAVRLDVLTGNVPAHRLYESVGFVPVITKELFYEDTGRVDFTLYELAL